MLMLLLPPMMVGLTLIVGPIGKDGWGGGCFIDLKINNGNDNDNDDDDEDWCCWWCWL